MKTRLFFRIYAVVLASLLAFALAAGGLWLVLDEGDDSNTVAQNAAAQLIINILPTATAPAVEQQTALQKVTQNLGVDVTLLDAQGQTIAQVGRADVRSFGRLTLPDHRQVLVSWQKTPWNDERKPLGWLFAAGLLGLLAIVALLSYPVVSRLTRRLEALRQTVAEWGEGDLSRRVTVSGYDEVAQLAQGFNLAAGRVEELLHAHKMLLANVSHELRTPMTRIRMNLEMLENELTSLKAQQRKADMLQDLTELNQMIETALISSRLDAQEHLEVMQPVDLYELSLQESIHYAGVTVTGAAAVVQGDPQLLRRLLRNLLDNASKYGAAPIEINVTRKVWQVRDSGNGVATAQPNDLFAPFARAHSGSTQGTGLGLAMVQKIAQLHGAQAKIVSKPNQGMCVLIEFM